MRLPDPDFVRGGNQMRERYANRGGNSNVHSFELGDGWITVWFNDNSEYHYTNASAGSSNIAEMDQLARQGHGLNSFIKRVVNKGYATKRL